MGSQDFDIPVPHEVYSLLGDEEFASNAELYRFLASGTGRPIHTREQLDALARQLDPEGRVRLQYDRFGAGFRGKSRDGRT
jgi:hypothetical protein